MSDQLAPPAPTQPKATVRGIEDCAFTARVHGRLEAVRSLWLHCESEGICSPFQRYSWVEGIVARLKPSRERILIVELRDAASGELRMLAPFVRRRWLSYCEIEWLGCGVCDYSAPVLADKKPWSPQAAEAAWVAMLSVLPRSDRICVRGIPEKVSGVDNPLALLGLAKVSARGTSGLVLSGPSDTLLKRICRPSFVKAFEKNMRQLEAIGATQLVVADTPALVAEIFDTLVEQRLSRFRKLGRFDLLTQKSAVEFYRDAALLGLSDGSAQLYGLRVGKEWVATNFVLSWQKRIHGILISIGADRWQSFSPGLLIVDFRRELTRD